MLIFFDAGAYTKFYFLLSYMTQLGTIYMHTSMFRQILPVSVISLSK